MVNDRYYPSLADLLSTDALPSELGFIKTGITDFFGKLYFKDFQFSKSEAGDRAFYSLSLVSHTVQKSVSDVTKKVSHKLTFIIIIVKTNIKGIAIGDPSSGC